MKESKVIVTKCPICEGDIEVPADAIAGEIVSCPDCGTTFEVSSINGSEVVLKEIETQGEDWGE